jgi:hypothetical protein
LHLLHNFTARYYTLQITITHRLVSSVTLLRNGIQLQRSSASGLTPLQGGDHLKPTSYFDRWLQLVRPSAASSQAGLTYNCQRPSPTRVRVRVTLRLAVCRQSIGLVAKPLEAQDLIYFLQLNLCGNSPYVTTSLTRRRVCF